MILDDKRSDIHKGQLTKGQKSIKASLQKVKNPKRPVYKRSEIQKGQYTQGQKSKRPKVQKVRKQKATFPEG